MRTRARVHTHPDPSSPLCSEVFHSIHVQRQKHFVFLFHALLDFVSPITMLFYHFFFVKLSHSFPNREDLKNKNNNTAELRRCQALGRAGKIQN